MLILLTSGNPLGLSAVGSGGRTATSSYEQITRTLRQGLGPAHAALFAEPSRRSGRIDWFAEGDGGRKPVRLASAAPEHRDKALQHLGSLVRDIRGRVADLQASDRADERILGEMIAHALEIPNEDAVFLLGEQPVLTFWGYVRNEGRPPVSPLDALLSPPRPRTPAPIEMESLAVRRAGERPVEVAPPRALPSPQSRSERPSGTTGPMDLPRRPTRHWRLSRGVVVGLIGIAALVAALVASARSCTIGAKFGVASWLPAGCVAPARRDDDPEIEPIPDPPKP